MPGLCFQNYLSSVLVGGGVDKRDTMFSRQWVLHHRDLLTSAKNQDHWYLQKVTNNVTTHILFSVDFCLCATLQNPMINLRTQ